MEEEKYQCRICGMKFYTLNSVRYHFLVDHTIDDMIRFCSVYSVDGTIGNVKVLYDMDISEHLDLIKESKKRQ